jgi:hypothetical protein
MMLDQSSIRITLQVLKNLLMIKGVKPTGLAATSPASLHHYANQRWRYQATQVPSSWQRQGSVSGARCINLAPPLPLLMNPCPSIQMCLVQYV